MWIYELFIEKILYKPHKTIYNEVANNKKQHTLEKKYT